ncbi:MAG TPA: AMP-dependent synthetase [Gammaproteobacteria bacterium]|nr:AMP-dependent synthetase [Gammaproteobacteria bacterium]
MNIAIHMKRAGRSFGENRAIALGKTLVYTYAELDDRCARLGRALCSEYGLETGDKVAIVMQNRPEYLELLYGCWYAGLAVVPVNAKLHVNEFEYILSHSEAKLCFSAGSIYEDIAAIEGRIETLDALINVDDDAYRRLFDADRIELAGVEKDHLAWLFYTSGTTGKPKGAMISHGNLFAMVSGYATDVDRISPQDCILHSAPLSHGSGIYAVAHVVAAACHVLPPSRGFDVDEVFSLSQHWKNTTFFAAPTIIKRLVDQGQGLDVSGIKTIVYGGAPMYVEDLRQAQALFGERLIQIYGQGESPMTITCLPRTVIADQATPDWEAKVASVGIPHSVVEVRIADANDTELPPHEVGEILVRGDTVMLGYWKNPSATEVTLKGGWLHTGDLGFMDEQGFLTLKDRSKDMLISGGINIYPREVEEVLLQHPDVAEVSVIGEPDPEWGENVVACVVLRPNSPLTASELDQFCVEHIARFKRPKKYHFLEALPKNNYGKVLKTALRDMHT